MEENHIPEMKVPRAPKFSLRFLNILWFPLLLLLLFPACTYQVSAVEQAVVTRFDAVVKVVVDIKYTDVVKELESDPRLKNVVIDTRKGLHFKWPFVDNVLTYDTRLMTYDTLPRQVITNDKKTLIFDNNAQWKIKNPVRFFNTFRTKQSAATRIDDLIYSRMNQQIGRVVAHTLISDKAFGEKMLLDTVKTVNVDLISYGVEVVDIRVRRTDFPDTTHQSIFDRMSNERGKVAQEYRSKGDSEYLTITSQADKEYNIITAEGEKQAKIINAEAESEAARIYNVAYGKDPEFFEFYRNMKTLPGIYGPGSKIVLDEKSPMAKYILGQ